MLATPAYEQGSLVTEVEEQCFKKLQNSFYNLETREEVEWYCYSLIQEIQQLPKDIELFQLKMDFSVLEKKITECGG
jgi:hypothetical protein